MRRKPATNIGFCAIGDRSLAIGSVSLFSFVLAG